MNKNPVLETNRLKSPPLSDELKGLLSPIPVIKNNRILFTIPSRVRNRLFVKKPPQQKPSTASPIIDKKFAESLKKMNSKTNPLNLTIDELESNLSPNQITKTKSSSIEESNGYEDNKDIEEITTPPSSQIESTHTSPNQNESPIKYRVYSTLSSTINIINNNNNDDIDDQCGLLSPLHSLNSSPNTVTSPSSTSYPIIMSSPSNSYNNKSSSFQECMNSNTVSPLPMNDIDTNINSNDIITDSPPAVKRSVRIINNPEIYEEEEEDNFMKRRRIEKRVLSTNVEFELSINTSVYNNKCEIVNYPEVLMIQDFSMTKSSSFNKLLMGKRSKSILKMYGQKDINVA